MNWFYFFSHTLPIIMNSFSIILIAFWLRNLSQRMMMIEHASYLRAWIESIEDGESLSDMAYMKEKGFLK